MSFLLNILDINVDNESGKVPVNIQPAEDNYNDPEMLGHSHGHSHDHDDEEDEESNDRENSGGNNNEEEHEMERSTERYFKNFYMLISSCIDILIYF